MAPKGEILTDTKTELQWDNIDWKTVYESVNRLQTRITKAVKQQNCKLLPERVMKGLSGMIGNFHVPFLEEGGRVIALLYSANKVSIVLHHLLKIL